VKIVYIDMDGVLVDFQSGIDSLSANAVPLIAAMLRLK
jgi:beta-phosphoglucomutase-like phosphatase (HAD superfamily)